MSFLVLGAGYTGARVAAALAGAGQEVFATSRDPARLEGLPGVRALRLDAGDPESVRALAQVLPKGLRALVSLPVVQGADGPVDPVAPVLEALGPLLDRVVYLSTTGVYGDAPEVDEKTPASPGTERDRLRLVAEEAVAAGPWSWMVLRPAAIYGAERGVHVAMRAGRYRLLGSGENFVSRIHVDDLAAIAVAALRSDAQGIFPVADELPARAREVAAWCAERMGLPMPPGAEAEALHPTLRSNRRVDGSAVRRLLGVELEYPTWRHGLAGLGPDAGR